MVPWNKVPSTSGKETKERRGKKRKTRDDEVPGEDGENNLDSKPLQETTKGAKIDNDEKIGREPRKLMRTPSRSGHLGMTSNETTPSASAAIQSPSSTIVTPSLKIRLPRPKTFNVAGTSVTNMDSSGKQ